MLEQAYSQTLSTEQQAALLQRLDLLQRADLILHRTDDLYLLKQRFLDLMMEASYTQAGTFYDVDTEQEELIFAVVLGPAGVDEALQGDRMPIGQGIVGHAAQKGEAIWVPKIEHNRYWARDFVNRSGYRPRNVLCLPLRVQDQVIAVVQLFDRPDDRDLGPAELDFLSGLVNDLALKVENAHLLDESREMVAYQQEMVARQQALLQVAVKLGTTLDREHLLSLILEHTVRLLQAEDASVFELDEKEQELVLLVATRISGTIRVPLGMGIAGWVARHGKSQLVPDVTKDPRFYGKVDEETSFVTHSILCTPLVIQDPLPGQEGLSRRRIIGVAQVLNKQGGGSFTQEDQEIFKGLSGHAAVALERVRLHNDRREFFTKTIAALVKAMEYNDPYTRGHTGRVTDVSVALAKELGLSAEDVQQIRWSGLLHDIGKIGMPDSILKKTGRVSAEEMAIIRRHPQEGGRILRELPESYQQGIIRGVTEHHERYDGTGYPYGLKGKEISLAGRIIAVADTFDAMTSTRSYRKGLPPEVAVDELEKNAGRQFDPVVVEAFLQGWAAGRIVLQKQDLLPDQLPED